NVDAAFTFAQKLSQAKNAQDVAKIQTEFMQTQFNAFSEQVKNVGAAYTETARGNEKTPSKKSDE
ncbi:MAG TPA: phasin family protein, partial [Pseudolabrys sp.]|nr:phasin family protein [Pseudolabrys sp.]